MERAFLNLGGGEHPDYLRLEVDDPKNLPLRYFPVPGLVLGAVGWLGIFRPHCHHPWRWRGWAMEWRAGWKKGKNGISKGKDH